VPGVLKLLLERLRNEITRLPAVKGFAVLAHSKLDLGLDGALEPVVVSGAVYASVVASVLASACGPAF
jgi:hypothetical protein